MSRETLAITFGALAPPLIRQLRNQGRDIPTELAKHFQRDADAITRCSIRGLLTERAVDVARRKILTSIHRELRKVAKVGRALNTEQWEKR